MMSSNSTIAVIGDIHGCFHTLINLYKNLKGVKQIYSVGDLVDRGRYSREVVEFCINNKINPVRGNHEDMMLKAVDNVKLFEFLSQDAKIYFYNGGRETEYSYVGSRLYSNLKKFKNELNETGHYDFIKSFPLKIEFKKIVISHAGIVEGGNDFSILWNRKTPALLDKLQVFGHTPLEEFDYKKDYYINIDTGCVYKNKLTAIIVNTETGNVDEIIEEKFNPSDLE